jgi:hypothetical protein
MLIEEDIIKGVAISTGMLERQNWKNDEISRTTRFEDE